MASCEIFKDTSAYFIDLSGEHLVLSEGTFISMHLSIIY